MPSTVATEKPVVEDKSNWVYVEVPTMDMIGGKHCGIWINGVHYASGKHFVSPELASSITQILKTKDRQDLRIIQPNKDLNALAALAKRIPAGAENDR